MISSSQRAGYWLKFSDCCPVYSSAQSKKQSPFCVILELQCQLHSLLTPLLRCADADNDFVASVADFTHLYADKPRALVSLCEFVFRVYHHLSQSPPGEAHLYHTLMELSLSEKLADTESTGQGESEAVSSDTGPSASGRGKMKGQEDFGDGGSVESRREKALDLLHQGWSPGEAPKYDPEHVLVLCRMHKFKEGLIFLYEHRSLLREVLQVRNRPTWQFAETHCAIIEKMECQQDFSGANLY